MAPFHRTWHYWYGFQWWSRWPSKTTAQDCGATRRNWYNREKRTSFMGLWCMRICSILLLSVLLNHVLMGYIFTVIGERRLEMDGSSSNEQEACSHWGSWVWQAGPEKSKAYSDVCGWKTAERLSFLLFCLSIHAFNLWYWENCFLFTCPAEFACSICQEVIKEPLTTPCAHNFCKTCLLGAYDSQSSMRERSRGGRTLRAQKIVKKCPSYPTDICDFLARFKIAG